MREREKGRRGGEEMDERQGRRWRDEEECIAMSSFSESLRAIRRKGDEERLVM